MTDMIEQSLPQGVPLLRDYQILIETDSFKQMESFSDNFFRHAPHALTTDRVVADGFHTWSRQWEYPFIYSHIRSFLSRRRKNQEAVRLLDAGSGYTFFPYYLMETIPDSLVDCCDYDFRLAHLYANANKRMKRSVDFEVQDLSRLGYADNMYDIIYCVSVLEHTHNYDKIFNEFDRVLRPGGLLVITFDISLDRRLKITQEIGQGILNEAKRYFHSSAPEDMKKELGRDWESDILNTKYMRKHAPLLLPPWEQYATFRSLAKGIIRGHIPRKFYHLTVFCGAYGCHT